MLEGNKALNNIGYGLYVVTTFDGIKDNGIIVNTVTQVTSKPNRVAVTINKQNYSCEVILKTKTMNVNMLTTDTPFSVFENFGFKSGRDVDKFQGYPKNKSKNGLVVLNEHINSYISLEVFQTIDLGTHVMFICDVTDAYVINNKDSMSYNYYLKYVKPKKDLKDKKGYVCTICGWVYEGSELPEDIVCPLCKHGAADFEEIVERKEKKAMKYVCDACGWEYDEELGAPELGIAPGTKFEDLPEDFECPLCGVGKDTFSAQ